MSVECRAGQCSGVTGRERVLARQWTGVDGNGMRDEALVQVVLATGTGAGDAGDWHWCKVMLATCR